MNDNRRQIGLSILSEIMGDDYVASRERTLNRFNEPLRRYIDENCFGDTWTRTALDRKTRSLILISTLTALNRPAQVAAHVRSAINNGATIDEIQDVLHQATVYCGVVAASDSFRVAEEVLIAMGLFDEWSARPGD